MGVLMFFRVQRKLDRGKGRTVYAGTITRLAWLTPDDQQRLVHCGAVTEVAPPPLRILPGWKVRSEKLRTHGITTAIQFLEADNALLQDILNVKREATIKQWKAGLELQLVAKPQSG